MQFKYLHELSERGPIMSQISKNILLYAILFIILIIVLYFHYFLNPILKQTQIYIRDISVFQEKKADIESQNNKYKSILMKKEQLQQTLSDIYSTLPENLNSYDIINLLSETNAIKLNKSSMTFLDPIFRQDFYVMPVKFCFITDSSGLLDFLSYLENLLYQPTISNMQVSAISIDSDSNLMDNNRSRQFNLQVEMILNFYMRGHGE